MEITSLNSYVEQICKLNESIQNSKSFFKEFLYRGHSDIKYKLQPVIARDRMFPIDITILNGERNLIELAKFKYPDIFRDDMQPLELLALLQHHGIPTRLLDVSENPLVALYFACKDKQNETNGEVLVFENTDDNIANSPIISAIADTYRLTRGLTNYQLSNFYKAALNQPYFTEQKHIFEISEKTAEGGGEWIAECCKKTFFVYAPIRTLRQQVQQGRYILFPNKITDNYMGKGEKAFELMIDEIPKDHKCIKEKFIIKKEYKKKILEDLKICGISKYTLFCDNLDIACEGIIESARRML